MALKRHVDLDAEGQRDVRLDIELRTIVDAEYPRTRQTLF
jgi:hypothetical protein